MRIGIDIRPLVSEKEMRDGLYQYVYHLVSNLLALDSVNNSYSLLCSMRGFQGDDSIGGQFLTRFPGRLYDLLWERLCFPIEWLMGKVDVFHGLCYGTPRSLRSKLVVTIHDLIVLTRPDVAYPGCVDSRKRQISRSVARADDIVTVSRFCKEEIVDWLKVPDERVRVIYNGVAPIFRPISESEKIKAVKFKYGIRAPYLLFVGNLEPRKNVPTLIRACAQLNHRTADKYSLVVVGRKAWGFPAVRETVEQLQVQKQVIFTDVADSEDLPALYSGAELFVFPSLLEGFGIPVLEAMACGTPVVASNRTAVPEVVGDAALLVDPMRVDELAEAMHMVLSKPSLRCQLIDKGLERSKSFSWETTARQTLKLYQEIG